MSEKKNLYIVYQPDLEVAVNELKKNTMKMDDDPVCGKIVGTEDGTVNVVPIAESAWLELKETSRVPMGKKLFLGNMSWTESKRQVVDIMYDNYGVKYGWLGDELLLWANTKALGKKNEYDAFLAELKSLTEADITSDKKRLGINVGTVASIAGILLMPWMAGLVIGGKLLMDYFHDDSMVTRQQMMYGISKLYYNDLDLFMKS